MSGIVRFIEEVVGDTSLSPAQKVVLRSVYGEPLSDDEVLIFRELTKLEHYRPQERGECTIVAGRGSGKSNQLASNLAIFEAVGRVHQLSVGEIATVMIISTEQRRQSRVEFNYILKKMEGSPMLRTTIESTTSDEIRLKNGVIIMVFPCNLARVRGASIQMCIADEVGFWKSEGHSIDREVLEAVRPGLRLPHSKLIKISSPYWMRGELFFDWKHYHGVENDDVLVFQGSTELFHPGFSKKRLDAARRRDPVSFATEYGAQFRSDLSGMYDPLVIDKAVDTDRPLELEPRDKLDYAAFVDVAGGGGKDSYAICLGHLEDSRIVIDVVRSRAPKFNPEDVTREYSDLLKKYRISTVRGDKFSGDFALHAFAKNDITYERAEKPKSALYLEAEGSFNIGSVSLPSRAVLVEQLKSLVRKVHAGGRDSVDTDSGQPEDESNVVVGLIDLLSARASGVGKAGFFFSERSVFLGENEMPDIWRSGDRDTGFHGFEDWPGESRGVPRPKR
jgi:hypothetical protein